MMEFSIETILGIRTLRENRQNIHEFFNGIWGFTNMVDKIWNILDENLFSIKYILYMKKTTNISNRTY